MIKRQINLYITIIFSLLMLNCNSDDNTVLIPTGETKVYTIVNTDFSDITGTVNFIENTNGSTTISINLENTIQNNTNFVEIRRNSANIGGEVILSLNDINGLDGSSKTTINKLDDGTVINYSSISDFTGYIAILDTNKEIVLAYADLGPNQLSGRKKTYNLFSPDGDINGLAIFEERIKGTTSLTVDLFNTQEFEELPCNLHIIREDTSLNYIHPLSPVKSKIKGFSFNELDNIDDSPINYDEVLNLDAFIKITKPNDDTDYISIGNIGSNNNASSL